MKNHDAGDCSAGRSSKSLESRVSWGRAGGKRRRGNTYRDPARRRKVAAEDDLREGIEGRPYVHSVGERLHVRCALLARPPAKPACNAESAGRREVSRKLGIYWRLALADALWQAGQFVHGRTYRASTFSACCARLDAHSFTQAKPIIASHIICVHARATDKHLDPRNERRHLS